MTDSELVFLAEEYLHGCRIISEQGATFAKLIRRYIDGELWDDPELRKLLSQCVIAARSKAAACESAPWPSDAWLYYSKSAELLEAIEAQIAASQA